MKNLYRELMNKVNEGVHCLMLTYLDFENDRNGQIAEKLLLTKDDILNKTMPLDDELYSKINDSMKGKIQLVKTHNNRGILIEPFIPKPRLIVFGGGHVALPLTELAARAGFSVVVVDDRPSFANSERFPDAEKVICESFEKSFDLLNFRSSDFVVIITRGHRHDGTVLRRVIKHDLSYIGMIGSKRRVKGMMEELIKEGFDRDRLNTVHAPIGLDINAVTPYEIGISIIGQLIAVKNTGVNSKLEERDLFPEFDREVAEKISEDSEVPKALITILSSKGSVPRKAGAKMVAYYDGRTYGSIGGGCSEAGIITKARDIMLDKGFCIDFVDMTGDVAESEGMVCGGIMDVLIEVF